MCLWVYMHDYKDVSEYMCDIYAGVCVCVCVLECMWVYTHGYKDVLGCIYVQGNEYACGVYLLGAERVSGVHMGAPAHFSGVCVHILVGGENEGRVGVRDERWHTLPFPWRSLKNHSNLTT